MNDRQIAFIMCVNDDRQADESEFYIRCLEVPEQYEDGCDPGARGGEHDGGI